jgi:hypothetical protein
MDFDQAVAAHTAWKKKLASYLDKHDGSLKPADVSPDNKCPLGQWIYGEGSRHSKLAEYSTLKKEHAHFHNVAADVVGRADAGRSTKEETALGSNSEFGKASSAVVLAIMAMKKSAGA